MDEIEAALAHVRRTRGKAMEWSDRVERAVVAAYEAGATLAQLADVMDVRSIETPRQLLIRHGVDIRSRGRAKQ